MSAKGLDYWKQIQGRLEGELGIQRGLEGGIIVNVYWAHV